MLRKLHLLLQCISSVTKAHQTWHWAWHQLPVEFLIEFMVFILIILITSHCMKLQGRKHLTDSLHQPYELSAERITRISPEPSACRLSTFRECKPSPNSPSITWHIWIAYIITSETQKQDSPLQPLLPWQEGGRGNQWATDEWVQGLLYGAGSWLLGAWPTWAHSPPVLLTSATNTTFMGLSPSKSLLLVLHDSTRITFSTMPVPHERLSHCR